MKLFKKRFAWAVAFTFILVSFTLYVVLDTFVIARSYGSTAGKYNFVAPSQTEGIEPASSSENISDTQDTGSSSEMITTQTAPITSSDSVTDTYIDTEAETENTAPQTTAEKKTTATTQEAKKTTATASETKKATTTTAAAAISSNFEGGTLKDSYSDKNITIKLYTFREYDTDIYVADVTVSSAEYLKTAFANDTYGRNVTDVTSDIAKDHNAIFAVNGDYYGAQSRGYVLRNGIAYRESSANKEDLVIYPDGSFEIISESSVSMPELLSKNAWQLLSFGPAIVKNSAVSVTKNQEVGKAMASNPRTAIGIVDKLHYLFVVSDGRTNKSEGLSLYQLGTFMQSLGVKTAYNLDGGGSSTMYFKGEVINNPTTNGRIKERSISDIVYIGY
ncbi:MAG: phosphodiester glycosidase family protein [Clostridia bacterium]|nr:phosphodiester glycosidase family protein [Clostridia bacterium]